MSLFLPVKAGNSSPAICGRCRKKMHLNELKSDPNVPGLRVCAGCSDTVDPYRKPARAPENIVLRNPRPDETLE